MNELALFAGAGGEILGGLLHGWRTVVAVEIEDYPRRVLLQRQADGVLPRFPIWDDIRTFDGKPWRGKVDIITGGFPCQDISSAGKGAGLAGERSGLWSEMARVISEVRPRYAFVENSPLLTGRGLDTVLMDLAEIGYDAEWCVLGADDVGAPHKRKRIWILAHANEERLERQLRGITNRCKPRRFDQGQDRQVANSGIPAWWAEDPADMGNANEKLPSDTRRTRAGGAKPCDGSMPAAGWDCANERPAQPRLGRVANGVADRVHRLRAIGNGQVPLVAAVAFQYLKGRMG